MATFYPLSADFAFSWLPGWSHGGHHTELNQTQFHMFGIEQGLKSDVNNLG